jgi:hypothetical protein
MVHGASLNSRRKKDLDSLWKNCKSRVINLLAYKEEKEESEVLIFTVEMR